MSYRIVLFFNFLLQSFIEIQLHLNDPTGKNVQQNQSKYESSFEIKFNAKFREQKRILENVSFSAVIYIK